MGSYLKYLCQLILSPGHGWEDIATAGSHPRVTAARGFYPLTAITSLTVFAAKIIHPIMGLQELLTDAIVTFVMYFIGYFIASFVLSVGIGTIVPGRVDERRCQTFALYTMGLLEVISIVGNIVPITMAITWFLPVYVAIVMWKGAWFVNVDKHDAGRLMLLAIPGVLLPPYLLKFLFTLLSSCSN